MDIQKEKNLYLAKLLEQEVIKQDEFEDLVFKPEINAFHSNYLSSRFMDNINFGWSAWQAAKAQAVPEWISVKDKLPGFNQSVLSCDGFETCVAEYLESCKNEYGVFFEEGFWINGAASIFENVTHWMPLPEAIEAQEPTND